MTIDPTTIHNDITKPPVGKDYTYELKFWDIYAMTTNAPDASGFEDAIVSFEALYDSGTDKFSGTAEQYLDPLWQGRFMEIMIAGATDLADPSLENVTMQGYLQYYYLSKSNTGMIEELENFETAINHFIDINNKLQDMLSLFHKKIEPNASDIQENSDTEDIGTDYTISLPKSALTDVDKENIERYFDDLKRIKESLELVTSFDTDRSGGPAKNGLVAALNEVIDTRSDHIAGGVVDYDAWVVDSDSGIKLTNAITATENFNAVTKNNVKKSMFVLEEFYKSAATTIATLNQILREFGQNIG